MARGRTHIRHEASLSRRPPTRRARECILIVCEGSETEPNYLRALRRRMNLSTVEVDIVGEGAEITGVIEAALRLREERREQSAMSNRLAPLDEAWLVVDTERKNDNTSWNRGLARAQSEQLKVAWSNPCFEYWLLLHFECIGRCFDGYDSVRPRLKRHLANYTKSADYFDRLAPRIPVALENARAIDRNQWQTTPKIMDRNPATSVHMLAERLIELAGFTIDQFGERFPLPASRRRAAKVEGRTKTIALTLTPAGLTLRGLEQRDPG
jgi:hypothetical protein